MVLKVSGYDINSLRLLKVIHYNYCKVIFFIFSSCDFDCWIGFVLPLILLIIISILGVIDIIVTYRRLPILQYDDYRKDLTGSSLKYFMLVGKTLIKKFNCVKSQTLTQCIMGYYNLNHRENVCSNGTITRDM